MSNSEKIECHTIHTTCAYCGVGCGIEAQVNLNERTLTVAGLESHPANYGRLCSKGGALGDTVGLDGRLLSPEVEGKQVGWEVALDAVASGFKKVIDKHGTDAVAFYLSGQLLTEDYYVANKLMKGFIGSANIDTNSRLCMSSSVTGHKRAFGTDTVPGCYEDFEQAELIVLVGSNTIWCHPVLYQRIRSHKEANPDVKIVVIDPRRTQTCDIADLHLPLALGTDSWLFNGLLNFLAEQNKLDKNYIASYCQDFDVSLAAAKLSSPSIGATAKACGVDEALVERFFSLVARTEKTITLYSQGVNQSSNGSDKVNAIINTHLATGRIGRPGMGPFSITGQPNAMGGREVGGLANTLASHMEFTPANVNRLQRFWQCDEAGAQVASQTGLTAVDLFDAIDEGRIKAVWIMATNPVDSMPDANKVKAALAKCDLVVVSDCVAETDTLAMANIKLPATGWSEKDGTVTSSERLISRQRNLLPPAGEAKHDWWIISQVAQRLGFAEAFNFSSPADIFREHAALSGFENNAEGMRRSFDISALKDITQEAYNALQPFQWPLNEANPNGTQRKFAQGEFFTPNRRAHFVPIEPCKPVNKPDVLFPLSLNTGRIRDQWHTMTRTALAPRLNQHIREPFLELHPADAKARGLNNQQLVKIKSLWGEMLARLNVVSTVRQGECFAPIHWTDQMARRARVGAVVNPIVDPFSFQPESKSTPVEVSSFEADWHALLLHREEHDWPAADYLVKVNGKDHSLFVLAGQQPVQASIQQLKSWVGIEPDWDLLSYEDAALGHYRLAALDKSGRLQAVVIFSKAPDLPDPSWLGMQFEKGSLDARTRSALLSGRAPAGEDVGRIVCACYSVGEKTIKQAVGDKKLDSIEAIGKCLKAGTGCGSCVPELKSLL